MKKRIKICLKIKFGRKISDLVGATKLKLNDTIDLNYNFSFRSKL